MTCVRRSWRSFDQGFKGIEHAQHQRHQFDLGALHGVDLTPQRGLLFFLTLGNRFELLGKHRELLRLPGRRAIAFEQRPGLVIKLVDTLLGSRRVALRALGGAQGPIDRVLGGSAMKM